MSQPENDTTGDSSSVAQDSQLLDLTAESSQKSAITAPSVGPKYDPRPHEDTARRNLAYALVGILALLVACILILVAFGSVEVSDIKEFGVLLGPVVALVSAATGFYYGTKSNK